MTPPLTPETALAMAHAGAHNEPEHYCRYPSSVTVPAEQMAAEVIRRLLILGFEVRRKDGPRVFGCVCTYEHGDSLCPVHPTCENCGCVTCECTKGGHRVQFHGSVCDEARLARDRDEWKERANKFEATVEMLEARGEADLLNAEAAIARATQAEAQAAAMREVLVLVRSTREAPGLFALGSISGMSSYEEGLPAREAASAIHGKVNVALDRHAGRTLLAELEALREVADAFARPRASSVARVDAALAAYEAAVDAARKGE